MNTNDWFRAIDRGEVQHDLSPITIRSGKHVGVFMVSADALRIKGVRHTCTPITAQQVADTLGCLLLTSKLYEERWKQATVKIPPCLGNVVKDDAYVHSKKVDKEIQIASGVPGDWLVADVGKAWILDPKCTATKAVNHGWIVGHADVKWTAPGKATWHGVPVSSTSGITGEFMIQNRGAAHGLTHEDYSQVLLLVDGDCVVDGVAMRTADVMKDPELCSLVLFNQMPLTFTRQPGVPHMPRDATPPPPSTDPSPMSWPRPEGTVGERAVAFAVAERNAGVKEVPDGSNNGPRIKEYLAPCERDGQGNIGSYLAKTGANWCAAFFWFCQRAVSSHTDPTYPYRCSGLESENDAKARGTWREKQLVLKGEWSPMEGDGVILTRGSQGWQRHVCRFMRRVDHDHFETIGGNEKNRIEITLRRFDDKALLGFIEMPPHHDDELMQLLAQPMLAFSDNIDDQNDGEKAV